MDSCLVLSDGEVSGVLKIANARKNAMQRYMTNTSQKETYEMKDRCTKFSDEIECLKEKLLEKEYEIRENKYEINRLSTKEKEWQDQFKQHELKHRATLNKTEKSLGLLERKIVSNNTIISTECDRIMQLVEALEKYSMQGHHVVHSHVFVGLLTNIRSGIRNLKYNDSDCHYLQSATTKNMIDVNDVTTLDSPNSVVLPALDSKMNSNSSLGNVENTLLEMCQHLESENTRLTEQNTTQQNEIIQLKSENANNSLIPHYRLAILRERSQANNLQDSLTSCKAHNKSLRKQLDINHKDMEKLVHDLQQEKRKTKQLKMERSSLLDDLKPILNADSNVNEYQEDDSCNSSIDISYIPISKLKMKTNQNKFHPNVDTIKTNSNSISMEEVMQVDKNKKVEAVKNEIAAIDANINQLKSKLENAAMSQTQNIVSDILRKQMQ